MKGIVVLIGIRGARVIQVSSFILCVILAHHGCVIDAIHWRRSQCLELLITGRVERVVKAGALGSRKIPPDFPPARFPAPAHSPWSGQKVNQAWTQPARSIQPSLAKGAVPCYAPLLDSGVETLPAATRCRTNRSSDARGSRRGFPQAAASTKLSIITATSHSASRYVRIFVGRSLDAGRPGPAGHANSAAGAGPVATDVPVAISMRFSSPDQRPHDSPRPGKLTTCLHS